MYSLFYSVRAISALAIFISVSALKLCAAPDDVPAAKEPRYRARLNCGARIECITPDGRAGHMETAQQSPHAAALIMNDDSISCPLSEGDTTFVVALPNPCTLERLKFINENVAARGTLRLAVSDEELPAKSARWKPVDGSVAFQNKRLFDLSVVGLGARFLRVTFTVEHSPAGMIAALYP